jgi:hypothetical protein
VGRRRYTVEQTIGKLREELLNREILSTLAEAVCSSNAGKSSAIPGVLTAL